MHPRESGGVHCILIYGLFFKVTQTVIFLGKLTPLKYILISLNKLCGICDSNSNEFHIIVKPICHTFTMFKQKLDISFL